ncbi:MAG: patatin-like phospholipase family protein [Acidiferrobacterales bacterium]
MINKRNKVLKKPLGQICVALLVAGFVLAAGPVQAAKTTQRFAIAISGGGSKGAYEAGINWALIQILRESSGKRSPIGGIYNPVELSSVAGASAGGINSLLSALAWCALPQKQGGIENRVNNNIFRDVWLSPDVNQLLPPTPDSPIYRDDDALLARKTLLDSASFLRKTWSRPSFRPGCRVPLGVTVTRVKPRKMVLGAATVQNQRFYIPFVFYVGQDRKGRFRFDPTDFSEHRDPAMILLPRKRGMPRYSISDDDVVQAVLTSSAVPIGFGRKRFKYCSLETRRVSSRYDDNENRSVLSDNDRICPKGYQLEEAEFADGGLFDNIPVGLARILAESGKQAKKNPIPVNYLYLNPNRLRYDKPRASDSSACSSDNPPPACRKMEYNISSESSLLLGALGTARSNELYRELSGDQWALNLSEIAYGMANELKAKGSRLNCNEDLPFFSGSVRCVEALRRSGLLLETAYNYQLLPITRPLSPIKLRRARIVYDCRNPVSGFRVAVKAECRANIPRLRKQLADALTNTARRSGLLNKYDLTIRRSRASALNDRKIRVSSRGSPITGTLLASFGAFMDYKFREYDYYVGIYDAVMLASTVRCGKHFSLKQRIDYDECLNVFAKRYIDDIGLSEDSRGRYVLALLAQKEFARLFPVKSFYRTMPKQDNDMRLIDEGLNKSLQADRQQPKGFAGLFAVENEFFDHLAKNGFQPTPTKDGQEPLLSKIMEDPDKWPHELMKRMTSRLVYLEQQAEIIYEAREPDPEKREKAATGYMGMSAYVLQSSTYKYPDFTFSPSTAPDDWVWRNIMPYEIAFDAAESDLLLTWQPTWAVGKKSTIGVRGTVGLAGGFLESAQSARPNYVALGLDLTRLTRSGIASSWGITPMYYHRLGTSPTSNVDTWGFDVHAGFLQNRLRVAIGARNVNSVSNTWFISWGLTDVPGFVYWLTR